MSRQGLQTFMTFITEKAVVKGFQKIMRWKKGRPLDSLLASQWSKIIKKCLISNFYIALEIVNKQLENSKQTANICLKIAELAILFQNETF